jgi:hypothetical protein
MANAVWQHRHSLPLVTSMAQSRVPVEIWANIIEHFAHKARARQNIPGAILPLLYVSRAWKVRPTLCADFLSR